MASLLKALSNLIRPASRRDGGRAGEETPGRRDIDRDGSRPSATETPLAPARRRAAPSHIGGYRVDGEIGRGAMGAVYRAVDPSSGEVVAIKTIALSREFGPDEIAQARSRFFREARTASLLHHPDIVAIRGTGEQDETAYIVMEYVSGKDLASHATPEQLLPTASVLRIVSRVAEALAYAHTQGVVHRDIKPANIMIDPSRDLVKVTDFGVARIVDSTRTRSGVVLGTPAFMSPEQMAGGQVDGRTDLYSLGVVLFNLLTGRLPHSATSMARLMFQVANQAAPDIRVFRPELPEALADVVTLGLEKRPEVRYADGYQMAADLRALAALVEDSRAPDRSTAGNAQATAEAAPTSPVGTPTQGTIGPLDQHR